LFRFGARRRRKGGCVNREKTQPALAADILAFGPDEAGTATYTIDWQVQTNRLLEITEIVYQDAAWTASGQ